MSWWKWIFCVLLFDAAIKIVSGDPPCNMKETKITCQALKSEDLYKNMSLTLSNADVMNLNITNSSIRRIMREMLGKYENIYELYLVSDGIDYIEDNAFADLPLLRRLYLSDNYLEHFNSNPFAKPNSLDTLDLSNNLLHDVDDFNITHFRYLKVLNLSNNQLQYLPVNLIDKLKDNTTFYLIVDNNPWNCSHPTWAEALTPELVTAFCSSIYDPTPIEDRIVRMLAKNVTSQEPSDNSSTTAICTFKHCFMHCIFWFIGSIWLGIILGNICKLKKLLFTEPQRYEDKNTQYGNYSDILLTHQV